MNRIPNSKRMTVTIIIGEVITMLFVIGMALFMIISRFNFIEDCESSFVKVLSDQSEWYRVYPDGRRESIALPATFSDAKPGETVVLESIIKSDITDKSYASTRANKQNMRIYVGGELRCNMEQKFEFFKWPMIVSRYVYADVSSDDIGKTIRIEGTTPFEGKRTFERTIYGEKLAIIIEYARDQAIALIAAFILTVLGLVEIIFGIILRIITHNRVRSDYYGSTMLLIALWDLTLCDFSDYLFTNMIAIRYIPAVAMSIIPMFMTLYLDTVHERRYHREYVGVFILTALNLPVCILLHTLDILLMPLNLGVALAMLGLILAVFIKNVLKDRREGQMDYYKLVVWAVCILGMAGLMQSIASATGFVESNAFLTVGAIITMPFIVADGLTVAMQMEAEKEKVIVAADVKSQFLATMSHEIRTPINAVLGMNEIILRESTETNIKDYAADIESAGRLLLTIVNDILDFSKIESGKMEIVPVDYNATIFVKGCLQMVEKRAKDKNLQLKVNVDPQTPAVMNGDRVRMQQIVTNLLTNAVKYTSEGSVSVDVSVETSADDVLFKVAVSDTGMGIKEESLPYLFNSFERLDLKNNVNIEGTGLGLSITQKLVNLMNGEIKVESEYGKGSTFTVIIPQKAVGDEKIGNFDYKSNTHAGIRSTKDLFIAKDVKLLIVDDVPLNLKVAVSMLKNTGMVVHTAASGMECLEMITKDKYDIIFLDHMMPEMDGIETRRRMKETEGNLNKDTPVIMLTANVSENAKEEYREKGFADYLAKPFSIACIEKMLMSHLPSDKISIQ